METTLTHVKSEFSDQQGDYLLIRCGEEFFALPGKTKIGKSIAKQDLDLPGVLKGNTLDELKQQIPTNDTVPVEFAGWLPAFDFFGKCGTHPQFRHIQDPPEGYHFVWTHKPTRKTEMKLVLMQVMHWVAIAVFHIVRPLVSLFLYVFTFNPFRILQTMWVMSGFICKLLRLGCGLIPVLRFVRSRHFMSQVMVAGNPNLQFLTSVPYTFGQHPWVIEIEDLTSLFFPFVRNGQTANIDLQKSPYFKMVKAMLEDKSCRGIITHMRSTADTLPNVFASDVIGQKTTHVPCGTILPSVPQKQRTDHIHMVFTCSWHQDVDSFFLRGGLEVLDAFEQLHERYPNLRLTLRTGLPRKLDDRYRSIIEKCWVRVLHRYLSVSEMEEMMQETQLFLLPAARIHVVSILRAMAYGQVVVASDGWGFEEYIEHGKNGILVPGRYGKQSWEDEETGMLREDYSWTRTSDPQVVKNLVDAISLLVEDQELREKLGQQARQDVADKYTPENWNRGLKQAFDKATRIDRG